MVHGMPHGPWRNAGIVVQLWHGLLGQSCVWPSGQSSEAALQHCLCFQYFIEISSLAQSGFVAAVPKLNDMNRAAYKQSTNACRTS